MKFKIVQPPTADAPTEPVLEAWLELDGDDLVLRMSKDGGYGFRVLRITKKGMMRFGGYDELGLPTDVDGRLRVIF